MIFLRMKLVNYSIIQTNFVWCNSTINRANKHFSNACDSFVNNKLDIHFEEDKTKSIWTNQHKKEVTKESSLYIKYGEIHIRQYHTVTYTGYTLDEDLLGGESIALNVIKKKKHHTQTFESGKYYPSLSIVFCLLQ